MTQLSPEDRATLLAVARGAVAAHLGLGPPPALPAEGPLTRPAGAFVSLHLAEALRGCIGTFRADLPLAEVVARMAVSAACEDPRFTPVAPAELPGLTVTVSVLGSPRPIPGPPQARTVVVGEQGLLVRRGLNRGTLLPRVAVEQGWTPKEFLKHACLKAGLHARSWEEAETEVQVFEAEEFGEVTS
jgi:AmmeMemoRadiSam system protein A